jgi:plastocyanin
MKVHSVEEATVNKLQRRGIAVLAVSLSVGLTGAIFAGGVQARPAAATKAVKIIESNNKYSFKAQNITISAGTKVTWTNSTDALHTVTSTGHPPATFNKHVAKGAKLTLTFSKKGTYHYYCTIHPYMKGTITVK